MISPLISLLILLVVVGVLLALLPLDGRFRTAIVVITILIAAIILLRFAGLL